MDANAQLALCTKAKLVFERGGVFLSFPALAPISFGAEALNFTGATLNLAALSDFSRLTNLIPGGTFFLPTDPRYLWEIYANLFPTAVVAGGAPAPATTAAYERAEALLSIKNPDGSVTDTPALKAYKQYRDAYQQAELAYKTAQTTEANSTDPVLRQRWLTSDEPALRAKVTQAGTDWATKGNRAAIEAALGAVSAYDAASPSGTWWSWSQSFNPDLDLMTDPSNNSFAPTGYSPSDATTQSDWLSFQLSAAEIAQLLQQAPAELKSALGEGAGGSTLARLTFEYRYVVLTRPWLQSEVFSARFWQLPPGTPALSDGGTPPKGACPAYITGVVFVRNIVEQTTPNSGGSSPPPPVHIPVLPPVHPRPPVGHPNPGGPIHYHPYLEELANRTLAPASSPPAAPVHTLSDMGHLRVTTLLNQLQGHSFASLGSSVPPAAPPPAPGSSAPTSPPAPVAYPDVSVLAFVCKPLPQCPNPDPSLVWPH